VKCGTLTELRGLLLELRGDKGDVGVLYDQTSPVSA
jgi:hypothetical protein